MDPLADALDHYAVVVHAEVAQTLGVVAREMVTDDPGSADPTVAALADALHDEMPSVRGCAATAVGVVGSASVVAVGDAVDDLVELLADDEATVRVAAAHAVGRMTERDADRVAAGD